MSEILSDEICGSCPKNQAELATRLKSIASCVNNDEKIRTVSIEFCKRAFGLLADCGLITEANVQFLSSAEACKDYDSQLKFPYNSSEGVLRKVEIDDDVYDAKSYQRFYRGDKMHVICGGTKYLIANIDCDKKIQAQGVNTRAFSLHSRKKTFDCKQNRQRVKQRRNFRGLTVDRF